MISAKTKRNISRIIPFGFIWFISSVVFLVVEKAAIQNYQIPSTAIEIDFKIFLFGSFAITCVGLLIGTIELLYINKLFAKKSFTKKIFYKVVLYLSLLIIIIITTYPIAASLELNTSIFDSRVTEKLFSYLISFTNLSTLVQLGAALGTSLFYAEISENIGHNILLNFFTGKYHSPTVENRIFMFSDMKSSTTIAEKLGHIKYFELLREYYNDLSAAIIDYSGEIYQYVGDEIVVSWEFEKGVKDNNCIKCFFAMKEDLNKKSEWYLKNFGFAPTFKTGFHYGRVTTGEIGALKKEIIFTGDVLNSTARIQELCNHYKVDLLISDDLLKSLNLNSDYNIKSLGKNELRGKEESKELFTIEQRSEMKL